MTLRECECVQDRTVSRLNLKKNPNLGRSKDF